MTTAALADLLPQGFVDAHHHVWAPDTQGEAIGYGWLRDIGAPKPFGDPTPIQRDYLMEEFLAEASLRPRATVHVQTDGALPDPVAETRFVQAQADRCGHAVKIVGLADLTSDALDDTLRRHGDSADFCGVRQIVARLDDRPDLSFAPRDLLRNATWADGLKRLENKGLTFDLQLYPEQAEAALEALSATPALTVIIDHALGPYHLMADADADESPDAASDTPGAHHATADGHARWLSAVKMMAARPNTYIKLGGWGMYRADWAADGIEPIGSYVSDLLLDFGADRIMWGSNYPVEKLATPYDRALHNTAAYIPKQHRERIFLTNSAKAYGIKLT